MLFILLSCIPTVYPAMVPLRTKLSQLVLVVSRPCIYPTAAPRWISSRFAPMQTQQRADSVGPKRTKPKSTSGQVLVYHTEKIAQL